MKALLKIFVILAFLISPLRAAAVDVLVLPSDLLSTKENYYNFDEMSEIIANDIINNFKKTNGKISSPDLYDVRAKFNQNTEIKNSAEKSLETYKNTKKIDYEVFKNIGSTFSCNYILIVTSSAVTNKNSIKRGVWDVLETASDFDIMYPFRLETSVVLLNTDNNIVMWSNNYSIKLGNNNNYFKADDYLQAVSWLEKLKMYSHNIAAPSASQNITLRFFPKAIRPVDVEIEENSGGALKFDKNIPVKPKQNNKNNEEFFGDMIYGI